MNLLGKAHDPAFWTEVREAEHFKAYRDELLNTWNKATKDYIPECLKYSEFKMFWTTGNRSVYEKPYFHRRHLSINAALLALIYPDDCGRIFQDMLSDGGIEEIDAAVKAHTGLDARTVTRLKSYFSPFAKKEAVHDPMEDIISLPITNAE